MTRRATMQDVAEAAGVSLSTVDRILNRRASVKRATVDQVLAAARRVGYHGVPSIQGWLSDTAPPATFGFLLNSRGRVLYSDFADMLAARIRASSLVRGTAVIRHLDSLDPAEAVAALAELGASCDAVAIVATDTPAINAEVERLVSAGTPVFTMFSDISTAHRSAFVGADGWKIGRGAGWMVHHLSPRTGSVGVLVGSSEYLAHRAYHDGLVESLRAQHSQLRVVEGGETLESDTAAEDLTDALLHSVPDLVAIFVAGGGLGGAVKAVTAAGRHDLFLVGTELSREADEALSSGVLDVVLSHPADAVARRIVSAMEASVIAGARATYADIQVPVDTRIRETL
ncbi:LacI family DNA-binding transcriptional regulator [Cereibacter sp. SYSU M97828]|nr:LacI family DNA-binding transcriptional regulator [Cereibacter flavus]